ncbi:hypothetical protein MVEN_02508800 [Mycena venus]|uniref:F-box domain-containing protein n=1 Tax=Mycena venus TaxID=2733690 RepID=A0A8H6WS05_9AGAR|nr:hypothetical protein MVEN_02508800 [Mycena venus]
MLLLNICSTWTAIALSTLSLWTAIHIHFPCAKGFKQLVSTWIERAHTCPLSISLSGVLDKDIATLVWRHRQQLKHLKIRGHDTYYNNIFGGVTPGPLPSLETLKIRGSMNDVEFYGAQVFDLLCLAPNLVESVFDCMGFASFVDPAWVEKLVLPNLRRMMFRTSEEYSTSDDDLLTCLTLPALETLSLPMLRASTTDLFAFLERSSPPLRELIISERADVDFLQLVECFRLIPTLTQIGFWNREFRLVPDFLDALHDSSLLPNLRRLTLHLSASRTSDSLWETLLSSLSTLRVRSQLVNIELDFGAGACLEASGAYPRCIQRTGC